MGERKKRARRCNYELLPRPDRSNAGPRGTGLAATVYRLLDELAATVHTDLAPARIVAAWRLGWKANRDGQLTLGQCKKASDFSKELCEHDFVILLNREAWDTLDDAQRRALLDHELCHAAAVMDPAEGVQQTDERGRRLWRTRRHEIEEFSGVIARNGLYKHDLEQFVRQAARHLPQPPTLFDPAKAADAAQAAV